MSRRGYYNRDVTILYLKLEVGKQWDKIAHLDEKDQIGHVREFISALRPTVYRQDTKGLQMAKRDATEIVSQIRRFLKLGPFEGFEGPATDTLDGYVKGDVSFVKE